MDRIAHANEWMKFAEADLDAAHLLKAHHRPHIEIICFHCQQAAEKALKAILAYNEDEIPKIHDLVQILDSCEAHCPGIKSSFLKQANHLSPLAIVGRYPSEIETTEEDMNRAIETAENILSAVKRMWQQPGAQNKD
jgi:HEPN domain-containing protein